MIIMGKSFFLISSVSVSSRFSEMCLPQAKIGRFHSRAPASMQIYWSKRKRLHKKGFNFHRIGLEHQHGLRFIALEHQYGRRGFMWKHSKIC